MTQEFVALQERRKSFAQRVGIERFFTRSIDFGDSEYIDFLTEPKTRAFAPFMKVTIRGRSDVDTVSLAITINEPYRATLDHITLDANSFVELTGQAIFGLGLSATGSAGTMDIEITAKKGGSTREYGVTG